MKKTLPIIVLAIVLLLILISFTFYFTASTRQNKTVTEPKTPRVIVPEAPSITPSENVSQNDSEIEPTFIPSTTYTFKGLAFVIPSNWVIGTTPEGFVIGQEKGPLDKPNLPRIQISNSVLEFNLSNYDKDRTAVNNNTLIEEVYIGEHDRDGINGPEPIIQSRIAEIAVNNQTYTIYFQYEGKSNNENEDLFSTILQSLRLTDQDQ